MSTPLPPPPPPSSPTPPPPPPFTQPLPAGSAPTAPSTGKGRRGLLIGVAIGAVAVLGVGAFLLLNKDDADDQLSTSEMKSAMQALAAALAVEPGSSTYIDNCPFGEVAELVSRAPQSVGDFAAAAEEESTFVYQPDIEGEFALVNCTLDNDDYSEGVGASGGQAVPDYREGLERVLPEFKLTFDDERAHRGGTIVQFCAVVRDPDAGFRDFCEADWYNDDIWVGVFISSDDQSSALAEEWLVEVLPDMISTFPIVAPTVKPD